MLPRDWNSSVPPKNEERLAGQLTPQPFAVAERINVADHNRRCQCLSRLDGLQSSGQEQAEARFLCLGFRAAALGATKKGALVIG